MGNKTPHSQRNLREPTIADVIAQAIAAVQSQKITAQEAMKAAMQTIGTSQKAALDLLLYATQVQARIVHELLGEGGAKSRPPVSEMGDLLLGAAARSFDMIGSVAAGLAGFLNSAVATAKSPPESQPPAVPDSVTEQMAAEPQPLTESELLDAIVRDLAEGFSAGRPGGTVAQSIRERYPGAIPVMQRYLAMDDFLVLMWLRQQPALAELAAEKEFPRFYAELKQGITVGHDSQ